MNIKNKILDKLQELQIDRDIEIGPSFKVINGSIIEKILFNNDVNKQVKKIIKEIEKKFLVDRTIGVPHKEKMIRVPILLSREYNLKYNDPLSGERIKLINDFQFYSLNNLFSATSRLKISKIRLICSRYNERNRPLLVLEIINDSIDKDLTIPSLKLKEIEKTSCFTTYLTKKRQESTDRGETFSLFSPSIPTNQVDLNNLSITETCAVISFHRFLTKLIRTNDDSYNIINLEDGNKIFNYFYYKANPSFYNNPKLLLFLVRKFDLTKSSISLSNIKKILLKIGESDRKTYNISKEEILTIIDEIEEIISSNGKKKGSYIRYHVFQ